MIVKIKKLSNDAFVPIKATDGSAAYDVFAPCDMVIRPGRQVIDLMFAIELLPGYEAKIEPRSGYSSKGFVGYATRTCDSLMRFDCDVLLGKIDSDYRGPIGVIVRNCDSAFFITRGQRIAQLTVYKTEDADFAEVDELSQTERGTGGFGHTGVTLNNIQL